MEISSVFSQHRIYPKQALTSKKRALETVSALFTESEQSLDANEIFSALIARERLGSTGLGKGIAIPHCHLENCEHAMGMLVTLAAPIEFDAIDEQPVDILFVLVVPDGQEAMHLDILAALAEKLSDDSILSKLRKTTDQETIYQLICGE